MDRAPYRGAFRLLSIAITYYADLESHYYQIDPLSIPLRKLLNLTYGWWVRNMNNEQRDEFDQGLNDVIEGFEDMETEQTEQQNEQAFMAAMKMG